MLITRRNAVLTALASVASCAAQPVGAGIYSATIRMRSERQSG